jgi:hypothetical protein
VTRARRVPRVALLLLESSGVEDEIAGDLAEGLARGHSLTWLWTEALAIWWAVTRRRSALYRRSFLTGAWSGLTVSWLMITAGSQLLLRIGWLPHAVDWRSSHYAVLLLLGFVCTVAAGWIVARLHRGHPIAALLGFSGFVMTAPLWKLPFIARLYPEVFSASVQPHLTFLILSLVLVAPISILVGGRMGAVRA